MAEMQEFKCPCCGGAITFDSSLQKMKCPYCDTEFDLEALASFDETLQNTPADELQWNSETGQWEETEAAELRSYVCNSCGGEIVTDLTTAATACPFCGNPVVMTGKLSGALKPDLVVPFKLDKKAAKEALLAHYKGKKLLPKIFKDENHIDEVKGVYVPFWLFDAKANARIHYKATRIRKWSDSRFYYTETSHFAVTRGGSLAFQHIPVDGSTKMADDLMESIEPFDMSEAVDFQTAYLAGYLADKYDVDSEKSVTRANERVKVSTESTFASTVQGYATVIPQSSSVQLEEGDVKYALLPVWLLNTTWNGEKYTFAMNGQTGKMVGNLPVDKAAYRKWLFGLTGAIGVACLALSYLVWLI